jgi:tungstate transport system ATP-binding protein
MNAPPSQPRLATNEPAGSALPLRVERLVYEAQGARLIDEVSFALPRGGATALLGANGAGKSLLLRLVQGLLAPTGGRVAFAGLNPRRRVALAFQRPVMLRRSARANLAHALTAHGATRAEAARRSDATLARFGLEALADRPARLLSGGEQQRLAIARAAALEPELLLLDEPTSALDPGASRQIETMLAALKADGVTLLFATHDLRQAERLADRALFLRRGRLVEDAPTPAFFASPASREARAFLAGELDW